MRGIDPVLDHFARLGVERRYDVPSTELDARYRDLSRKLHPDRFARAEAKERLASLQAATALNDAYRVLKDPVRRAEYLLALEGIAIDENEKVEQEFLLEILELREALAEAKAEGDAAQVEAFRGDMQVRYDAALEEVERLFREGGDRQAIKEHLVAMRYFQRFLDEITGKDEGE